MKKTVIIMLCVLMLISFAACGSKEKEVKKDLDFTDSSLGFGFDLPEGYSVDASDKDGYVYVYKECLAVPYIMIKRYTESLSMQAFKAELKESVLDTFEGAVMTDDVNNNIGGKRVVVLTFTYELDGYNVTDSRAIYENGTDFYVFTSKIVPSLEQSLNAPLDFLMKSFTIL